MHWKLTSNNFYNLRSYTSHCLIKFWSLRCKGPVSFPFLGSVELSIFHIIVHNRSASDVWSQFHEFFELGFSFSPFPIYIVLEGVFPHVSVFGIWLTILGDCFQVIITMEHGLRNKGSGQGLFFDQSLSTSLGIFLTMQLQTLHLKQASFLLTSSFLLTISF